VKRPIHALILSLAFVAPAALAVTAGEQAPDFALTDLAGKPVKLSDHKGSTVVLEWVNPECPYVRKHYDSANMPTLQKEFGGRKVVWLTINSTNANHPEFKTPEQMGAWMKQKGGTPAATLLDRDGKVGKLYSARTTPHMYIVDPKGKLVYAGAIDDKRSTNPEDIKTSKNYVRVALGEALAGKPVTTPSTTPYGCSVKY
jgi:glutathione peroxidase-family protein